MDNNTCSTCKCMYFVDGYIACKICAKWVEHAAKAKPNDEPIILAKRWSRKNDNDNNQNEIAGWL